MRGTFPESVYVLLKAFLWQKRLHERLLLICFHLNVFAEGFIHLDKHIMWLLVLRRGVGGGGADRLATDEGRKCEKLKQ